MIRKDFGLNIQDAINFTQLIRLDEDRIDIATASRRQQVLQLSYTPIPFTLFLSHLVGHSIAAISTSYGT